MSQVLRPLHGLGADRQLRDHDSCCCTLAISPRIRHGRVPDLRRISVTLPLLLFGLQEQRPHGSAAEFRRLFPRRPLPRADRRGNRKSVEIFLQFPEKFALVASIHNGNLLFHFPDN